jgi:hypothetical protein
MAEADLVEAVEANLVQVEVQLLLVEVEVVVVVVVVLLYEQFL